MTDQGGWGQPPQRRPDEPNAEDTAREQAPAGDADRGADRGDAANERPTTYGAPSYGAPSYGAPSYGPPAQPAPGAPTAQESYGRHGRHGDSSADAPTRQESYGGSTPYGQPSTPPAYQQPTSPAQQPPSSQPTPQQPTQQQPTYGQPGQQYGAPASQGQPTPQYGAPASQDQPTAQYGTPSSSYGGYAPPAQNRDVQQTPAYGGYGAYQSGQPGQPGQPGPYGAPGGTAPASGKKKRSGGRLALIIGLVVILVAGLGTGAWALFLRGGPAVTWQGKEVANPEALLTQAQDDLAALVTDAKGVKGEDTRCYYAVPKNPPKDTPETDVADTLYCGPALFVDGDTSKPFVPYGITAGAVEDDKVTLAVGAKGSEDGVTAVPGDQKLVRPDGASAPDGAGGLKVPEPPPADENVFTTVSDLDVDDAPEGATMAALDGGVTIEKLGEVDRYGTGSDARSAPDGQKLIAFQLGDAAGDDSSDGASVLDLQVSVDGGTPQDLPDLTGINVIAVPTDAKSVDLVTKANNVPQTLSLLDGKPGSGNIAVLSRGNRFGSITVPKTFNFTESAPGASVNRPCTLAGSVVGLFYWADDKGSAKATSPGNAILETDLKYTFATDSPPPFTGSNAGDSAFFVPKHLTITLSTGQKYQAKTVADRTVFEVPASFTEGTITISGAFTNVNNITFTVAAPINIKVSIPAS